MGGELWFLRLCGYGTIDSTVVLRTFGPTGSRRYSTTVQRWSCTWSDLGDVGTSRRFVRRYHVQSPPGLAGAGPSVQEEGPRFLPTHRTNVLCSPVEASVAIDSGTCVSRCISVQRSGDAERGVLQRHLSPSQAKKRYRQGHLQGRAHRQPSHLP